MKKLLTKLLLYFCLMTLVVALFLLSSVKVLSSHRQFYNDYTASIADKIARLESITEPKVILVGNSNVAFGIDSSILEKALEMPVVNLGLHGGLGEVFHYNMAKRNIRQGDIVVLLNTHFGDGLITQTAEAWTAVESGSDYWKFIPPENWLDMFLSFPTHIENTINAAMEHRAESLTGGMYARSAFNAYGDNSYPREEGGYNFSKHNVSAPGVTKEGISEINKFSTFCQQQGASCLLAAYPIAFGEFTAPEEEFLRMQQKLESSLDCSVISDYTDYFFDYQYFYDTQYHLTTEGARLRTEQLAEDILRWQSSGNIDHS